MSPSRLATMQQLPPHTAADAPQQLHPPAPPAPRPRLRHRSSITIGLLASHARDRVVATLAAPPAENFDARTRAVAGAWGVRPLASSDEEDSFAAHLRTHCSRPHRPPLPHPISDTRASNVFSDDARPCSDPDSDPARLGPAIHDVAWRTGVRRPSHAHPPAPSGARAQPVHQDKPVVVPLEMPRAEEQPSWDSNVSLRFAPVPGPSSCELLRPVLAAHAAAMRDVSLPTAPEQWHMRTLGLSPALPGWAVAHPVGSSHYDQADCSDKMQVAASPTDWTLCVPLYAGAPSTQSTAVLAHVPHGGHAQPFGSVPGGTFRLLGAGGAVTQIALNAAGSKPSSARGLAGTPTVLDMQALGGPRSSSLAANSPGGAADDGRSVTSSASRALTPRPRPRAATDDLPAATAAGQRAAATGSAGWTPDASAGPTAVSRSKSLRTRLGIKRPGGTHALPSPSIGTGPAPAPGAGTGVGLGVAAASGSGTGSGGGQKVTSSSPGSPLKERVSLDWRSAGNLNLPNLTSLGRHGHGLSSGLGGNPEVRGRFSHSLSSTARVLHLPQPQSQGQGQKTDARRSSNGSSANYTASAAAAAAESSSSPSSSSVPSPTHFKWGSTSSLEDREREREREGAKLVGTDDGPEQAARFTGAQPTETTGVTVPARRSEPDPSFHMVLPHPTKRGERVQVTFAAFPLSSPAAECVPFRITAAAADREGDQSSSDEVAVIGHCECGDKVELFPLIWDSLGYPLPHPPPGALAAHRRPGAEQAQLNEDEVEEAGASGGGWADSIVAAAAVLLGL